MGILIDLNLGISLKLTNIDLEDYGMTQFDWDSMESDEREEWLYENVIDNYDTPSWVITDMITKP